jgi:3-hydroxyisobutyrate dehydrogenase-like beta-hydroxyacid dehydrogenase
MSEAALQNTKLGWIGTGRMGYEMVARLARAGCSVTAWNRTRTKAEPLTRYGVKIADQLATLADCDIVFTMVSTSKDLAEVLEGPLGLFSNRTTQPRIIVDCSSISMEASAELRESLNTEDVEFLASPVSGNAKVIKAGKLSVVCSGPQHVFDQCRPFIEVFGAGGVSYVGPGELARIAKICHNVFLGVITQSLTEITVLAEKAGLSRHAFLQFMNDSVMGSAFTRYKTPAFVNLDFKVTFTPELLRKDLDLGLESGRNLQVPMPLTSMTRDLVQTLIGNGHSDKDFAALLLTQAQASGLRLKPENVAVDDGLDPAAH